MYLLAQAGLFIAYLISPIPEPSTTITLTMKMEGNNASMVNVDAQIVDRVDETIVYGRCTSNNKGVCVIEINDELSPAVAPLTAVVRGRLDLGISGSRSFIFERGKDQSVIIPFTQFGQVIGGVSHEPHPSPASFDTAVSNATPTALPAAVEPATPIPTTKYVVIDPYERGTAVAALTSEPTVASLTEANATSAAAIPLDLTLEPLLENEEQMAEEGGSRNWVGIVAATIIFLSLWGGGIMIYLKKLEIESKERPQ